MNIGTVVSTAAKITYTAWNHFRSSKNGYINAIIRCLSKATQEQYEYLRNKITNYTGLPDSRLIYWETKSLKRFFKTKFSKGFVFHSYDSKQLAKEIEPYFILSGHTLSDMEKQRIVQNIIISAQQVYQEEQTMDPKVINFIGMQYGVMIKNILDFVSDLPELTKKLDQLKQNIIHTQENDDFSDFLTMYRQCVSLYESEDYLECLYRVNNFLTKYEPSIEEKIALILLEVGAYYQQYNYDMAYQRLLLIEDEAIKINDNLSLKFYGIKGTILSEKGTKESNNELKKKAIVCFEHQLYLIDNEINNLSLVEIYYNLGTTYSNLAENEECIQKAIEYFELALELDNTKPELFKNLGTVYGLAHRHDEEVECYKRALDINPSLFEGLCAMAFVERKYYNNAEKAIDYYKRALKQESELIRFPSVFYWMADAYLELDNLEDALISIEKGLKYEPTSLYMIEKKIDILYELQINNPKKYAQPYIDFILTNFSNINDVIASKIVMAYLFAEEFTKAEDFLGTLADEVRMSTSLHECYFYWASMMISTEQDEKAGEIVDTYIDLETLENHRHKSFYYYIKGMASSNAGNFYDALSHYLNLLVYNNIFKPHEVLNFIGQTYLYLEDYNQSRIYYRKAQKEAGDSLFDIELGLCKAYIGLKRIKPAIVSLKEMARISALHFVTVKNLKNRNQLNNKDLLDECRMNDINSCIIEIYLLEFKERLFEQLGKLAENEEDRESIVEKLIKSEEEQESAAKKSIAFLSRLLIEISKEFFSIAKDFPNIIEGDIQQKLERVRKEML